MYIALFGQLVISARRPHFFICWITLESVFSSKAASLISTHQASAKLLQRKPFLVMQELFKNVHGYSWAEKEILFFLKYNWLFLVIQKII